MRIAIFGSYKEDKGNYPLTGNRNAFENACFQLGSRLAKDGHQIITGSPSGKTADYHVVKGAVDYLKDKNIDFPFIEILRPAPQATPFLEDFERYPQIFKYHLSNQQNWQGSHLFSIKECDCVFTIGGGRSTYSAGLAAIIAGKKLFPIGSFGGASKQLLSDVLQLDQKHHKDLLLLNNPWANNTIDKLFEISEINNPPKILIIHGRSEDYNILKDYLVSQLNIPAKNIHILVKNKEYGKAIPVQFEELANTVHCAIALATPDDYGYDKHKEDERQLRARQNVWLEIGWFWGKLGLNKVLIISQEKIEIPSDLLSIRNPQYKESPNEVYSQLKDFLKMISGR